MKMKEKLRCTLFHMVYMLYRRDIIHNDLQVLSIDETISELIHSDKSLVRYGDAEISMIEGISVEYQEYDQELSKKMKEILQFENENLLVAIPDIFGTLEHYTKRSQRFWKEHLFFFRKRYYKNCNISKTYYNAFVSRCYYMIQDKSQCENWFHNIGKIWENKDIIIVEGDASHNGVGNDLFVKAKSVERIICPGKDAYRVYDKILNACLTYPKDRLFLTAVGNTAKILTARLVEERYRVIDIGNLDMEYEWYLKGAELKEALEKHNYLTVEENLQAGYTEYINEISHRIS
ncbi:GT-D fold domain-containing glycosyltransferase [Kineothrix sp. MB12-C1]|uniref:GT-D fold domain-containing glycosyltransferase n=1 Tax=Kineothrix sp. MB12-C1 TaxID=3070215 RepID=UPI0027D3458D|nr:GT-D fold domain-containing glycosyltransferase [Kineothrix sp. MB12-C1]WMC91690.1 GT-D fold domain-containing glycosyltransferase [Kineothrix sp. MB12-C1]